MPQSLCGYRCEGCDSALRIDLQHLVVTEVDGVEIPPRSKEMPFGQLNRAVVANDETALSFAILAIELLRQFAT
jgi:hypothetical protein